jgi:hypothetical protein
LDLTPIFARGFEIDAQIGHKARGFLLSKTREAQGTANSLINLGLAALILGDHERTTGLLLESLTLLRKVDSKEIMVECLETLAGVAGARGQPQRAARLWGAAQRRASRGCSSPSSGKARVHFLAIERLDVGGGELREFQPAELRCDVVPYSPCIVSSLAVWFLSFLFG